MAHIYVAIPAGALANYAATHGRIDPKAARKVWRIRVFTVFRITSKTLKFRGPCGRWHYYNVGVQPDNVVSLTRACGDGVCPQVPPEPVPGPLYELLKADFNTILELERLYDDEDREAREDKRSGDKRAKNQALKEQHEVFVEGRANKRARKAGSSKIVSRSTPSDGEGGSTDNNRLKQISDDAALALKLSTGLISEDELKATMSSPSSPDNSFHTARSSFTDGSQGSSTYDSDDDVDDMPTSVSYLLRKVKTNETLESSRPLASSSRLPTMVTTPIAPRLSKVVEMIVPTGPRRGFRPALPPSSPSHLSRHDHSIPPRFKTVQVDASRLPNQLKRKYEEDGPEIVEHSSAAKKGKSRALPTGDVIDLTDSD